jgi:hypothetical protein
LYISYNETGFIAEVNGACLDRAVTAALVEECRRAGILFPSIIDLLNIQIAYPSPRSDDAKIIDFEHIHYRTSFDNHLALLSFCGERRSIELMPRSNRYFIRRAMREWEPAKRLAIREYSAQELGVVSNRNHSYVAVTRDAIRLFAENGSLAERKRRVSSLLRELGQ